MAIDSASKGPGAKGCFVRLGWMLGGSAALFALTLGILREPAWTFTVKDALFWGAVAATLGLRWLDVTKLGGRTTAGAPATPSDLRRYAAGLAGVSAVLWTLAQSLHLRI